MPRAIVEKWEVGNMQDQMDTVTGKIKTLRKLCKQQKIDIAEIKNIIIATNVFDGLIGRLATIENNQ